MPYDQAVALHERQRAPLDRLCQIFDAETQSAQIVDRFAEAATREPVPPSGSELTLSPEQARHLLDSATSRLLSYRRDLDALAYPASYVHDSLDAAAYLQGRSVAADLREDPVPSRGTEVEVLLDELFTKAITNGTLNAHPGFLAHVPSGGLLQGAVGEFIARALNRFGGVWLAAPGLQQIEANVVRWFCTMMGYGPGSFGYLTTGGSVANFMAVVTALRRAARSGPARSILYTSAEAHFSVVKAASLAGMSPDQVSAVGTAALAMDVAELARRIRADRAAGHFPAVVVATAGTTNTGAIDDLAAIAELCRAEGLWLHVDACFGGFFRLTARGKAALRGIEQADSIAVDAHKSLFLPMGSSALLVSDRQHLRSAFEVPGASYLPGFVDDPDLADLCNYGPDLSREIRGLAAWLPLKMHGVEAFERGLDDMLDLAGHLAEQLSHLAGIEVIEPHPRHLPVVTFALRGGAGTGRDAMNARLCELICASGNVYVTTTTIPGHGVVVRACLLNPATDRRVVDRLLDDVARAFTHMISEPSPA